MYPILRIKRLMLLSFSDVREGDFLAMNVHEWHANTKIIPITKDYSRVSLVSYLRERMLRCSNM